MLSKTPFSKLNVLEILSIEKYLYFEVEVQEDNQYHGHYKEDSMAKIANY